MADSNIPPFFVLDAFLPYQMNRLAQTMSQELAGRYQARFGITIAEWRVLAHLSQHRNVSVREVHERVAMDKTKISRAAARLEQAGLIEKGINEADRRLLELRLTEKGRALFAEIVPLAMDYQKEALATLTDAERRQFVILLEKLLKSR